MTYRFRSPKARREGTPTVTLEKHEVEEITDALFVQRRDLENLICPDYQQPHPFMYEVAKTRLRVVKKLCRQFGKIPNT